MRLGRAAMVAFLLALMSACAGPTVSVDGWSATPATAVSTSAGTSSSATPTTGASSTRRTTTGDAESSRQSGRTTESAESEESGESGESEGGDVSYPTVPTDPGLPDTAPMVCPSATVRVNDAESLTEALASAAPGTAIELAAGIYAGTFTGRGAGTEDSPIWVCGGRDAVIDGGSVEDGYAFHLEDAQYWRLVGFSVRQTQKGVMVDRGHRIVIQDLSVTEIGDEAIHLRGATTYSVVRGTEIERTGLRKEKFGEGIYIGSASSNWCTHSDCGPDRSNNNAIVENRIIATSAESIDIKEGTQDGLIRGNTFDGAGGLTGADSWVDVKGNGWTIVGNSGQNSPVDGFQVHSVEKGWGKGNVFEGNTAAVNGSGYGFKLAPVQDNVVTCDNRATGAESGLTNTPCA